MNICVVHNKEYLNNLFLCEDCILEQNIIINNGRELFQNNITTNILELNNNGTINQIDNEVNDDIKLISPYLNYNSKLDIYNTINEKSTCNICLLDINYNDIIRTLNCEHFYHAKCIDKWFEKKSSCPMCRNNLYKNNL